MKNMKWLAIFFLVVLAACYDDLGNYDYDDSVNEVEIELAKVYGVRKMDTTLVIRPVIRQTSGKSRENLRFMWRMSTKGEQALSSSGGDTLSYADTVALVIDTKESPFNYTYWLRFYVEDLTTGTRTMIPTMVSIVKPYEGCWMVLHEQSGYTKLGSIEYVGDNMLVTDDAYYKERGEHLTGKPVHLDAITNIAAPSYWGYDAAAAFYCFTDNPAESGLLRQDDGFSLYGSMEKCIYPDHYRQGWKPDDVTMIGGNGNGSMAISGGKVFQGSLYIPRMYGMFPSATLSQDYYISHGTSAGPTNIVYDKLNRRFLNCYTGQNWWWTPMWGWDNSADEGGGEMDPIFKHPSNASNEVLDDIGEDKEMVYIGTGFWYGSSLMAGWARICIYAVANSKVNNKTYVYEFHSYPLYNPGEAEDPAPFTGYYIINTPTGFTAETPCASSADYNRILFYAVDNRVYRLDFGQTDGKSQLIWQHPDGGAKAKAMKMARKDVPEDEKYQEYGHLPNRSLGIAFETSDGNGEVVILNLNNSGKVDSDGKYPSTQIHSGFGKIKDILFL